MSRMMSQIKQTYPRLDLARIRKDSENEMLCIRDVLKQLKLPILIRDIRQYAEKDPELQKKIQFSYRFEDKGPTMAATDEQTLIKLICRTSTKQESDKPRSRKRKELTNECTEQLKRAEQIPNTVEELEQKLHDVDREVQMLICDHLQAKENMINQQVELIQDFRDRVLKKLRF